MIRSVMWREKSYCNEMWTSQEKCGSKLTVLLGELSAKGKKNRNVRGLVRALSVSGTRLTIANTSWRS